MGRKVFKLIYPFLSFLSLLICWLPKPFLMMAYNCFSGFPTLLGVLIRYVLLSAACKEIGKNVYIARWVVIKNPQGLKIGDNVSVHEYCYLDACGGVSIGSNVSIAHGSSLVSFEHTWKDMSVPIKYNKLKLGEIALADDVWIGCGVRILASSCVGERAIVAAGAVVKGDCSGHSIYAGVPAKKIKSL